MDGYYRGKGNQPEGKDGQPEHRTLQEEDDGTDHKAADEDQQAQPGEAVAGRFQRCYPP